MLLIILYIKIAFWDVTLSGNWVNNNNKNIVEKSLKVKFLSLDIKYMMFFGVTVQKIE